LLSAEDAFSGGAQSRCPAPTEGGIAVARGASRPSELLGTAASGPAGKEITILPVCRRLPGFRAWRFAPPRIAVTAAEPVSQRYIVKN
jgi:hypothetical protein